MIGVGVAGPRAPVPKYGQPVAPNLNVRHLCPNCRHDPPNIIEEYSKGDLVCADCGTILGDRIVDTRSEWRTFAGDEGGDDPSRVGDAGNPLLGANALDTMISGRDGNSGMSRELQRAQNRANNIGGKANNTVALQAVFSRIAEKCDLMQLPHAVASRAQHVYKIADDKRVIRGKSEPAVIAACIIFACRDAGADRSFAEICKAMRVTKKELSQVFTIVKSAVVEERAKTGAKITAGTASLADSVEGLLGRLCNYLDLGNLIYNAAKHIAVAAAKKTTIDGRSYTSIAAGVLYFTCVLFERSTTTKEICEVAEVSEATIKLICKMVSGKVDEVIRPEWRTEHPSGYAALVALSRVNENVRSRGATPRGQGGTPAPEGRPEPVSTSIPSANGVNGVNGVNGTDTTASTANGTANGNGHINGDAAIDATSA